jgi:dTDP-4-amino-4,6-dideoxygalactose transaminase
MVDGVPLGSLGDAAVFSFYATKIVTGGQGGLIWSRSKAIIEKARDYREFDARQEYVPRFNFQLTDIQAALVSSQLTRLDAIRARRAQIAAHYLSALPVGLAAQSGIGSPGRMAHRFIVVAPDLTTRERLRAHMQAAGIGCIVPIERFELLHRYLGLDPAAFPASEQLADVTLSLPIHLQLTDAEVEYIAGTLRDFHP